MSETITLVTCKDTYGRVIHLLQIGRSFLVASDVSPKECPHDKGFKALPVEPDLYAYVCNCGCGFKSASNPDDPTAVRFVRHVPSPEDKAVRLSKGGEK
jgi:hypothetical protein